MNQSNLQSDLLKKIEILKKEEQKKYQNINQ